MFVCWEQLEFSGKFLTTMSKQRGFGKLGWGIKKFINLLIKVSC